MPKFCEECGTATPSETAKFCSECGHSFMKPTAAAGAVSKSKVDTSYSQPTDFSKPVKSSFSDDIPPPPPQTPPPPPTSFSTDSPAPEAATGADAERLYHECLNIVQAQNPSYVPDFKSHCKSYGNAQLSVKDFVSELNTQLGQSVASSLIPKLVLLIPHKTQRALLHQSTSSSQGKALSHPTTSSGGVKTNPGAATGIVSNRYADHPTCDICNVGFELTKRRHQCRKCGAYVCSACSPNKYLIPTGQEYSGTASKVQESVPQRVCVTCAKTLFPLQDDLVKQFANCHVDNPHDAKNRIHVPYSSSMDKECRNAADIVGNFFRPAWGASKDKAIPVALLEKAHGLAVMTIIKAGFLITGKIGTGLVVAKLPDGSWSAPSAIGTAGIGGGLEIGGELVEVMIILGSPSAVKVFYKPQLNIGAGLDLTLGPYGRVAEAAAAASKTGLNANYSYSQSKGLYAGISLQGAVITTRKDINTKFYSRQMEAKDILNGNVEAPRAAKPLYDALSAAMKGVQEHREDEAASSAAKGACVRCPCTFFVPHTKQVWKKECKSCKHIHS